MISKFKHLKFHAFFFNNHNYDIPRHRRRPDCCETFLVSNWEFTWYSILNVAAGKFSYHKYLSDSTRYTVRGRGAKRRTASEYFQVSKELWGTCLARQTRQFEIRTRKSQSAGMESVRNHDHCFLTCCQKASKWGSESGPWTGQYKLVTFLRAVHFWILQNQKFKLPVDRSGEAPSISPSQKSIILRTHGRTDGRTSDYLVPTEGKSASRNEFFGEAKTNVNIRQLFVMIADNLLKIPMKEKDEPFILDDPNDIDQVHPNKKCCIIL